VRYNIPAEEMNWMWPGWSSSVYFPGF